VRTFYAQVKILAVQNRRSYVNNYREQAEMPPEAINAQDPKGEGSV
jgi:hypothetical protein